MDKRKYTLQEKMHDWLYISPGNIVWQDSFFYDHMVKEYGREAVDEERKRQEADNG